MESFKFKWWRFGIEFGTGIKTSTIQMTNHQGRWVPVIGTRLLFLVETSHEQA